MVETVAVPIGEKLTVKRFVPAAAMTLAAGAVTVIGGYVFHKNGWALAGPLMYPAGPLISIGFLLAARAAGAPAITGLSRLRIIVLLLLGVPSPGGSLSAVKSLAVTLLALAAGVAMAVAGYAIAAWTPFLAPPLVLVAGAIILVAFVVGRPAPPVSSVTA